MSFIDVVHGQYVFGRRVRVLARHLAEVIPPGANVLDVGSGDGTIASLLLQARGDLRVQGIDVLVRPDTRIPVKAFDGRTIPHPDGSFDVVMFIDVLHHTEDPAGLLREAVRVARRGLVIKDHHREGLTGGLLLRFMDWVGNARHGVVLPYNYWPRRRWAEAFTALGLRPSQNRTELGLYPPPVDWVFGRGLHFLALLDKT